MSTSTQETLQSRPDALIFNNFKQRAHRERAVYLRELAASATLPIPELAPGAKRKLTVFAAAFGLAAAAFWAVVLTDPPQTSAAQGNGMPVFEMMRDAPLDLTGLGADAI